MVTRALLVVTLALAATPRIFAETFAPTEALSVPAGTMLHCRTTQTLTTKLNNQGDAFTFNVTEPVNVSGRVAIPAGATISGHITRMERPGRFIGVGQMYLTVEQITFPDGRSFPISAALMAAYGVDHVKVVGNEGLVRGPSSHVQDFGEIGAGTAGGTFLGLILGHPIIGATVGFTATTVDRLRRRGKDLTIPVGTEMNYWLTRDFAITRNATRASANPAPNVGK